MMIWKPHHLPNEWIWKAGTCGREKTTIFSEWQCEKILPPKNAHMYSMHASEQTNDYSANIHAIAKCLDIKLLSFLFLSSQSNHIIRNLNKTSVDALCNVLISMNAKTFEMWWFMRKSQWKLWFNDTLIHAWDACEEMWVEFQFW